jgi:hypothetical protein
MRGRDLVSIVPIPFVIEVEFSLAHVFGTFVENQMDIAV